MAKGEAKQSEKKVVPVEEGLFTMPILPGEEPHLIGSKCKSCGTVFFPRRVICGKCCREGMEEIILSRRGKVTTWTVIRMKPPGYKDQVPYVLGEVELHEGVLVRTHFSGVNPENPAIKVGDEAEVVLEKIYEDEEGNDVVCYKFRPV